MDRAFALAALAPYLDEPSRAAVAREALEAARGSGTRRIAPSR